MTAGQKHICPVHFKGIYMEEFPKGLGAGTFSGVKIALHAVLGDITEVGRVAKPGLVNTWIREVGTMEGGFGWVGNTWGTKP